MARRRSRRRGDLWRHRALALAVVCALGLAACGDDDDAAMTITSDADGITEVDGDATEGAADEPEPADADRQEAGSAAGQEETAQSDAGTSDTGRMIPADMPDGIPIPDDHVVLRAESATYDDEGAFVGVNLAIGGTVAERRDYYAAGLTAAYGDVEVEEEITGEPFRFQGDWFELGRVYLSENEGYFDSDTIDTSELPVIVTIQVSEIDPSS